MIADIKGESRCQAMGAAGRKAFEILKEHMKERIPEAE